MTNVRAVTFGNVPFNGSTRLLFTALAFVQGVLLAQNGPFMSDPVFGMSYDTRKVHFESAPAWLRERCQGLPEKSCGYTPPGRSDERSSSSCPTVSLRSPALGELCKG